MAREKKAPAGAPGWMVTFADLMSLLLCFFVLLLSFSSMDQKRFYDAVGSMREAFGITTESMLNGVIELQGIPFMKQTRRLIPLPVPTAMLAELAGEGEAVCDRPQDQIGVQTRRSDHPNDAEGDNPASGSPGTKPDDEQTPADLARLAEAGSGAARPPAAPPPPPASPTSPSDTAPPGSPAGDKVNLDEVVRELKASMSAGMETAGVSVENRDGAIRITLPAASTFPSGSDDLAQAVATTIDQVASVLSRTRGRILVVGHTDDIPISTWRFQSNWELSTARAISVLRRLADRPGIDERRLVAMGQADTAPLVPNQSPDTRARNRRVEIVLIPK